MDYYDLLGVSRNASDTDIKKAYKKQSMQHHPDRTGGDDSKFKEINEAYQVLSNKEKRQMYDQFGTADPQQAGFNPNNMGGQSFHFNMGQGGMEDIFSTFFGNGFQQQRRQPRNRDITIACDVTLNEVYTGKGVIATFRTNTGKEQTVNIDIPKGVRHGDTINYSGLGDDSIPNMPRGNLFVKVRIKRDPNFERDGYHLHTTVTVSVFDLMLGTATNLSLPNGRTISINIPQGTQPGTVMSINGQGLPDYNSGTSGNVYMRINGLIPKNLTEEQKDIIRKLK